MVTFTSLNPDGDLAVIPIFPVRELRLQEGRLLTQRAPWSCPGLPGSAHDAVSPYFQTTLQNDDLLKSPVLTPRDSDCLLVYFSPPPRYMYFIQLGFPSVHEYSSKTFKKTPHSPTAFQMCWSINSAVLLATSNLAERFGLPEGTVRLAPFNRK